MDNRQFNVKGRSKQQLKKTLECLLLDEYGEYRNTRAWSFNEEKGLILYWYEDKNTNAFLSPPSIEGLTEIIWDWLNSEQAASFKIAESWDEDFKHDGSNEKGFRIYNDEWGHVKIGYTINHYSICAISPAYCWYGK